MVGTAVYSTVATLGASVVQPAASVPTLTASVSTLTGRSDYPAQLFGHVSGALNMR